MRRLFTRNNLILLAIFLLALFVRTFNLSTLPLGFHADEVMNGYVGRYILQNGVDLYGNRWPLLYFDNFGDFPNVLPMYLSGLFTYMFGPTMFAVRLPIAVFGALTVFPLYGLVVEVFKKRWLGLAGALLLAVTPWHVVLSRATAEGVTAAFVFMSALWLLVTYLRDSKSWRAVLSVALFGLTYFLYPSYRVVVPLVWVVVPFMAITKRMRIGLVLVTVLFFALTLCISQTPWGKGRFEQTSIFASGHEVDALTQRFVYNSGGDPVLLTRAFHNKALIGAREFVRQYMSYFSGEFLLSKGGLPERYKVPDVGLLYYGAILLVLMLLVPPSLFENLGIQASREGILQKKHAHIFAFLMWIILLIPIPAALTRDDVPNVHRTALLGVLYILPVLYGLAYVSTWKLKRLPRFVTPLALICMLIALEFIYFVRIYTVHADNFQALARHDETNSLMSYLQEHEKDYDVIVLPSHHQMALRYLMAKGDFGAQYAGKFQKNIYLPEIGRLHFYQTDCPSTLYVSAGKILPEYEDKRLLIVDRVECADVPVEAIKTITTIQSALHVDVYRVLGR